MSAQAESYVFMLGRVLVVAVQGNSRHAFSSCSAQRWLHVAQLLKFKCNSSHVLARKNELRRTVCTVCSRGAMESELLEDLKVLQAAYLRGAKDLESAQRTVKEQQDRIAALVRRTVLLEGENRVHAHIATSCSCWLKPHLSVVRGQ